MVREGGVTRASEKLHVSQPTISGQIRELEAALGEKLLRRSGRNVVLTDVGRTVYRYADEILALDRELLAHRRDFPRSLNGAPFLLPGEDSALRLSLDDWFRDHDVQPRVVGTFQDSALLDAFGQAGAGLFAMPSAIEAEVKRQYKVRLVGRIAEVRQQFYAITVERKLRNPAVLAISERARALFS